MTTYGIDRDVPLAKSQNEGSRVYPWFDMEVGDSFFVPLDTGLTGQKNLRASIYNAGRNALMVRGMLQKDGYRVVVRKMVENGVVGLRAWLLKKGEGPTPTLS
tara:strand:+ start:352 stop:660 length:309 start_codon:yes stop_codon:yes gene_type:complete